MFGADDSLDCRTHRKTLYSHVSTTNQEKKGSERDHLDEAINQATALLTCAMRNLPRKGKESQPIGHFQELLEAYGDLPADTTIDRETEGEKSYSRVSSLVA
jgi:hypothetical protein